MVKIPLGEQHCENSAPIKAGACCSWWFTVFLEVSVCACLDILGVEGAVVLLLCWQWMKRLRPCLGLAIQQQRFSLCSRSCVSLQTYIWKKENSWVQTVGPTLQQKQCHYKTRRITDGLNFILKITLWLTFSSSSAAAAAPNGPIRAASDGSNPADDLALSHKVSKCVRQWNKQNKQRQKGKKAHIKSSTLLAYAATSDRCRELSCSSLPSLSSCLFCFSFHKTCRLIHLALQLFF